MTTRIGVDIGGTFTDLVYFDDQIGESREGKVPTVPDAPEKGTGRPSKKDRRSLSRLKGGDPG